MRRDYGAVAHITEIRTDGVDAILGSSTPIKNGGGVVISMLELRYRPRVAPWHQLVRVNNTVAGATALTSIQRKASPAFWETE